MQLLSRSLAFNLAKQVHKTKRLPILLYPEVVLNNTQYQQHQYGTNSKQNLLKFPAMPLEDTLNKFYKTIQPFLTEKELKNTQKFIDEFKCGPGMKLQQLLEKTAKKEDNWLATRWLKAAYLSYRDPVCVYSSPGMSFPFQKFKSDDEYLQYAAKAVYGALKYKELAHNQKVPILKMGKFELDNSQFEKVFGTCRIPGVKEDSMEYHPDSEHIVIIYKNNYYKLPITSQDDCSILHPNLIYKELKNIYECEKENGISIGVLSSDNRDCWGQAYQELISISCNLASVKEIQQCLFTISLDQETPIGCNHEKTVSEQLIHGGGSKQNAANRWFDKTIQLIVNKNGVNGFCYEHSPAEGGAIAMMTDFIVDVIKKNDFSGSNENVSYEKASKLEFNTSEKLNQFISTAEEHVDKLAADLHMNVLHYKDYGKGFLKTQKLSPDSFIQLAIQFAFYKLHKTPGAQYESAHLRIYMNGRTETIRSCSKESTEFCESMFKCNKSDEEKVKLLRNAVNTHRQYTNEALLGKGVDRHLLGLKLMALENNLPIPEFFTSPAVVKSSHFRLATSQVPSINEAYMCYGPLTPDGYGCCYSPREKDMFFAISSWHSNPDTCSDKYLKSLTEAFDSMREVLESSGEKPKSKL